jgi:hypothetical protein
VFFILGTTAFHSTKVTGELADEREDAVYLCFSPTAAVLAERGRHCVERSNRAHATLPGGTR